MQEAVELQRRPVTGTEATAGRVRAAHVASWSAWGGFAWALSYVQIHVYWAVGGTTPGIGITSDMLTRDFRLANVSACIVIVGAGLTCLSLVQAWGSMLPNLLRHGVAWFGGILGILHATVFSGMALARLAGWVDYPAGADMTPQQLHSYDIANLAYFEPWFAVMGILLLGTSIHAHRRKLARCSTTGRTATVISLALLLGVVATCGGTMFFQPWLFLGVGPVFLLIGVCLLVRAATASRQDGHVR